MIGIIMMLALGLFTFITFKYSSPAMFIMWGITGIALMLSFIGVVSEAIVFLLFILMIVVLMITGVYTEVYA